MRESVAGHVEVPLSGDIFEIMRADRERVLKEHESLRRSLIETLYDELHLPIGLACYGLGGMQNQLYAWSHDFASSKYVGIPITNRFLGFTGAEWEYFNIFFAEGSAVALALIGGYYVAQALWKKRAEINLDNRKLKELKRRQDVGSGTVKDIDDYLTSKTRWLPDFEKTVEKKHTHLYRINRFLKSRYALPIAILLHTAVLSTIHYTWAMRYYEGKNYVGGIIHESVFWNWTWFVGAYSTYIALQISAYYFFYSRAEKRPGRKAEKLKRRIEKLRKGLDVLREKKGGEVRKDKNYIKSIDTLIRLEKELIFWETLR